MIGEPKTLRHLIENANEGYAVSVVVSTRFSDDDIVKRKVGGFKKVNDYLYQWWTGSKWKAVDGCLRDLSKYFQVDNKGYKMLTGEWPSDKVQRKLVFKNTAQGFHDVAVSREWTQGNKSEKRVEVRVYRDTKKMNHASGIYIELEQMLKAEGVEMIVPEFTTAPLKNIADMLIVKGHKIEVFEIKSKADTFKRLEAQLTDYKRYADRVWVVIDVALTKKFNAFWDKHADLVSGVGVLFYDDGKLTVDTIAQLSMPTISFLDTLWAIEKESILFGLGLPHSSRTKDGSRDDRIKNVCLNSDSRVNEISRIVLMSRIQNFASGLHPTRTSTPLDKCAGQISLYKLNLIVYGQTHAEQYKQEHIQELPNCNL